MHDLEQAMDHSPLYRQAEMYDVAFQYRDVEEEVAFFDACMQAHALRPLEHVTELASGPGYHALAFARRGLRVVVLDRSAEMVELCAKTAAEQRLPVRAVIGDMRRFDLGEQTDLALNLLTSISYLTTRDALADHFVSVAEHLRPGGLYIVENNHPRDFVGDERFKPSRWVESRDDMRVETTWRARVPRISFVEQLYDVEARYKVERPGQPPFTLTSMATLRMTFPQELAAAAERAGLELAAWYGDFSLDVPLSDDDASWRTIAVFRRPV